MCLTSKRKLKEKFRFLKDGKACASPKKIQNIEFCFIRVRHVPQLERKRSDTIFYNQE